MTINLYFDHINAKNLRRITKNNTHNHTHGLALSLEIKRIKLVSLRYTQIVEQASSSPEGKIIFCIAESASWKILSTNGLSDKRDDEWGFERQMVISDGEVQNEFSKK